MDADFWIKKWQDGEIRFHQSKYHPQLEKFGDRFSEGTILVPLCGKSLDMLYLSSLGHSIIGVELSEIACRDFFIENGIPHTEKTIEGFILFESLDITLWCGDFFNLPQEIWDKVTGIYDRAALVALPEDLREKYAAEVVKRTKKIEVFLISFEYPEGTIQGPPFSVPEAEIKKIYDGLHIKLLNAVKENVRSAELVEKAYWLTR